MDNKPRTKIADTSGQDKVMSSSVNAGANKNKMLIGIPVTLVLMYLIFNMFSRLNVAEAAISRDRLIIGTVERGKFIRDISANGQVVAAISPTLYSTATGTVTFPR